MVILKKLIKVNKSQILIILKNPSGLLFGTILWNEALELSLGTLIFYEYIKKK